MAIWLIAKPQNSILALGATTLLPPLQIVSGIILAMLAIATGVRNAVLMMVLAGGVLVLIAAILGSDVISVMVLLVSGWMPVLLLVTVFQVTRSAQLTLQLSVLTAAVAVLGFGLVIGDSVAYWQPMIEAAERIYQEQGVASPFAALGEEADAARRQAASFMTAMLVVAVWLAAVLEFMLGGGLYNQLPGDRPKFARFRDINLGQVLATLFVGLLAVAFLTGIETLYQVGIVVFAAFLIQGLAVAHWLHLEGHSPGWTVVLLYVLLIALPQYVLMAVAVVGLMDAWIGIRRRFAKHEGLEK